jgi:uncharacterized protein with FMN-binding domain
VLRRAVVAIIGTAVGTTVLVGLKAGLATGGQPATTAASAPLDPAAAGSPLPAGGQGAGTPVPGGTRTGTPRAGATTGRPGGTGQPRSTAPAGGTGLHPGVFTGAVAQTDYGPVQVRITVTGGRITDAAALRLPDGTAMSVEISRRAGPALRQETLAAQSVKIDTVSGASYTSQGYRTSLQSALDAAMRG